MLNVKLSVVFWLQGYSVTPDLSPARRLYLSTSLSRFDHVRRRQMLRMKKRTDWFLSPPNARSHSTSREQSEATSSEALDHTMSDGGLSDTEHLDSSGSVTGAGMDISLPLLPHRHTADVVNGNHLRTSTPAPPAPPSHSPGNVTDREVRYFMVDNYYGTAASGAS